MLTFKLFQSGLYLTEADVANPSTARVGFLFQDSKRTDPTFELNPTSWADKNSQGYFCFFAPASSLAWQRPWGTFAANIRKAFVASAGSQFAFFTDDSTGAVNAATTLLISGQGTSSPTLDGTATFASRNVTLQITPSPFASVSIAWDDANNQFTIDNSGSPTPTQFIFGTNPGYLSTSPQLLLPLTGDSAGSINAAFQFAPSDLDLFETGLMYFAPPQSSGANLTALSYPVLRGPGGATGPLNFSFWFDVLDPLDDERTYFQIIETALGSYFAAANGDIFKFNITQTGPVQSLSRLVFNNRPIQTIQDNRNFYLALAGAFSLALDSASAKGDSGPSSAILLCGVMGTEFFNASLTAGAADSITFVPSQPAYASGDGTSSQQLDNSGGNTVTSWAQFTTSAGSYVSQPEQGPLFQQSDSSKVSLAENNSDGNNVHLLSFLPLAAWQPNSKTPVASPAVPLVPYSGIAASVDLTPYRQMETSALNPTRKNLMAAAPHTTAKLAVAAAGGGTTTAMTPQGLLSILTTDTPPVWTGLQIATSSGNRTLQFTNMGAVIRTALNQNRIFAVISTLGPTSAPLFAFAGSDNEIDISDWVFSLSPAGEPSPAPACIPPIVIMKFYDGQTLEDLANDTSLWSSPDQLNTGSFNAAAAQQYIQGVIADARKSVAKDANSLYANFVSVVTDPNFSGILALNSNLQLNDLPDAIQAVLGGMTKTVDDKTVSNVDAFRAHHVGIAINDTDPNNPQPVLSQSSLFALVDYEKPSDSQSAAADTPAAVDYGFEVEYLRALFLNSELRSFACQINLTVNKLFDIGVNLLTGGKAAGDGGDANVIQIMGSYQDHSGGSGQSQGVYSFVTQHSFSFNFQNSQYLDNITLDKLQFSFSKSSQSGGGSELHIGARFAIWGSMKFKALDVLDVFSIDSLAFADLGITVDFDLQLNPPQTSNLALAFSPGDLRLDLGATKNREGSSSLLALLPFRLTSFLYSQNADQTLESLNYFRLAAVEGLGAVADTFNYALLFDLDLGSIGALVGSLSAFKF